MTNQNINILHKPFHTRACAWILHLTLLCLGGAWTAHAQPASDCAQTCTARNEASPQGLRQERMRLRATTVLPGQTAQDVARVRAKHDPPKKNEAPIKSWSDYDDAAEGLQALKKDPVAVTLRNGEHINGDINYYTEDAVLIVSEEGSLHIVEIRDIQQIDAVPKSSAPTLTLSQEKAQTLEEKQQQHIRDKIRDYRLKKSHQHIGRPMRIAGGTMLGVGALLEVWGLTALTTGNSADDEADGEPFGNAMALPVAIAGAPLIATGIGLIFGANIKRNRAIHEAREKNITYSVAPSISPKHVGAGATIQF